MENIDKRALTAILTSVRETKDIIAYLSSEKGCGFDIQDSELYDMHYQLVKMAVQLTQKIEAPEPTEINLEDHVPGAVIEPKDTPERDLSDFDI